MSEKWSLERYRAEAARQPISRHAQRGEHLDKPRRKNKQPERDMQITYFAIIHSNVNLRRYPELKHIHANPNGGHRDPRVAAMMKAEGVMRGLPDIELPFMRRGYVRGYIENKCPGNVLSPEQIEYRDHLIKEGGFYRVCYSVDIQLEITEWYLGIELVKN